MFWNELRCSQSMATILSPYNELRYWLIKQSLVSVSEISGIFFVDFARVLESIS